MRRILIHRAPLLAAALLAACGAFPSAPHLPFPALASTDGALLRPLRLVTVVSDGDPLAAELFAFSDAMAASDWWRIAGDEYALGPMAAGARITGPAIADDIADHDLFTYVDAAVRAAGGPLPDGNTVYLVYLPPGIALISGGTVNTNCRLMAGGHRAYGLAGDNLAFAQRCDTTLDQLTVTSSHEVFGAATDPTLRGWNAGPLPRAQPWSESVWRSFRLRGHAEAGELCEGTRWNEGDWFYQRIYSTRAAARGGDPCVPAEERPYYNVSAAAEWFPVAAGQTIDVPVRGWATGQTGVWSVSAQVFGTPNGFTATVPASAVARNDYVVDVQLAAPDDAPSGSYAVVELYSGANPPIGSDLYHFTLVGAYVP